MNLSNAQATPNLPPVALSAFEGPLDLLLHLIREHKINIADIPIVQVTDYYCAYLREMESFNLTIAGEFFVLAATLLEIKSRMLLPKQAQAKDSEDEDEEDPRKELVERLLEYQRYKAFVQTLSDWEGDRRQLYFRGQAEYGDLYELPVEFGTLSAEALRKTLLRLLQNAGVDGSVEVTSVRRQKVTLSLAMAALLRKVKNAPEDGILFDECLDLPLVRVEIIMMFLALLELLRQAKILARQHSGLDEIWLSEPGLEGPVLHYARVEAE